MRTDAENKARKTRCPECGEPLVEHKDKLCPVPA